MFDPSLFAYDRQAPLNLSLLAKPTTCAMSWL